MGAPYGSGRLDTRLIVTLTTRAAVGDIEEPPGGVEGMKLSGVRKLWMRRTLEGDHLPGLGVGTDTTHCLQDHIHLLLIESELREVVDIIEPVLGMHNLCSPAPRSTSGHDRDGDVSVRGKHILQDLIDDILIIVMEKGARRMHAAGYVRVSSPDQAGDDRFGLADQRHAIAAYAKSQKVEMVAWYADEGVSGAILERPQLQQMVTDANGKTFQMVLVAKMDRLARDLMAQLWIEKELLTHAVELVSAAEPFRGQDPSSVLFRQIIGAFAQFEKARITERMSGGRKQKARTGGYAGGRPPIGYHAVRGSKVLHFDPVKAEAVVRVLTLRRQHPRWTLQQIAAQVNADGYTTAHGAAFQPVTIKRILDRRNFYAGQYRYADIKAAGVYQQILPQDLASPKKRGRAGQPAA